jgi:hypothetical protein
VKVNLSARLTIKLSKYQEIKFNTPILGKNLKFSRKILEISKLINNLKD